MRESFINQLETLHAELVLMGALCEDSIASAIKGLIEEDTVLQKKVVQLESEINHKEREIEDFCLRLLIREQPVAGDLRQINSAQKLIANMERIGDQALDIAEISAFMTGSHIRSDVHISDMARATVTMLQKSVDSFVTRDIDGAKEIIAYDDIVDDLFIKIKNELVEAITKHPSDGGACLDLLMIAKYLERIGDHAVNIAEQVIYTVTGERGTP